MGGGGGGGTYSFGFWCLFGWLLCWLIGFLVWLCDCVIDCLFDMFVSAEWGAPSSVRRNLTILVPLVLFIFHGFRSSPYIVTPHFSRSLFFSPFPFPCFCTVIPDISTKLIFVRHPHVRLFICYVCFSNASLEAAAVLRGHNNSISAVHATGSAAFSGDWDGHVCMWNIACLAEDSAADRGVSNQVRLFIRG